MSTVAVLLAAGRGSRLTSFDEPKCLLKIGGMTLLERRMRSLEEAGITSVYISVGYKSDSIRDELASISNLGQVTIVENPNFNSGSMYSLACQAGAFTGDYSVLLADADVLCPDEFVTQLTEAKGQVRLLYDMSSVLDEEPVKVCFSDDDVIDFSKTPSYLYDRAGESVGLFMFEPEAAETLGNLVSQYCHNQTEVIEYEQAITDMVHSRNFHVGAIDVTGSPWTEIDFDEDIDFAMCSVLPGILRPHRQGGLRSQEVGI